MFLMRKIMFTLVEHSGFPYEASDSREFVCLKHFSEKEIREAYTDEGFVFNWNFEPVILALSVKELLKTYPGGSIIELSDVVEADEVGSLDTAAQNLANDGWLVLDNDLSSGVKVVTADVGVH